jgi:short-subunit dehydrogenase
MQRIFLTGASSGLGRGLALELAGPDRALGLVARRSELLEELSRQLRARGSEALVLPADVSSTERMAQAAHEFLEWAGGVDLVLANAGIGEGRRSERVDAARVAQVFTVNVIGVANTLLPWVAPMRAQGSGILAAVSSVAGFRALPGSVSYSASKAAVTTFVEGLRMELHGSGVHAMTLCPGFVRTPLTDKNDFSMPFLMDCERACRLMVRAIERRETTYVFPWQMRLASKLLRHGPEWFVRRAAARGRD